MAGIRISGLAFVTSCSPPFGASSGAGDPAGDDNYNVYRACSNNLPGEATLYTDFADGATVVDGVHNPRLSPDQTKILFEAAITATGLKQIWVVDNTPGSTPTLVVSGGADTVFHPSWHPDSDQFVYVKGASSGSTSGGPILSDSVSVPGSPVTLKAGAAGFTPQRPQFNFDGSRVAYLYQKVVGTPDELRVMDDDGSNDANLDNLNTNPDSNNPQEFGWANAQNTICYSAGSGASNSFVINDDGSGKTQINVNGAAAGAAMKVTSDCWAPDDSYVVVSANLGNGFIDLIRAELDGSNTTRLDTSEGAFNQDFMRGAYVFRGRIWFIQDASNGTGGKIASVALDGSDYVLTLDVNAGAGNMVDALSGGDGFLNDF